MRIKNAIGISISIMILVAGLLSVQTVQSAEVNEINMHIVGEKPVLRDGMPLMVAGLWHIVDINTDDSCSHIDLYLSYGNPEEENRSVKDHYHWTYDSDGSVWKDAEYGTYIVPEKCEKFGGLYTFYIGVDGKVDYGVWNMSVVADGKRIIEKNIVVERPSVSSAVSSADFSLRIDPFTAGTIDSEDLGQYVKISDTGNTPLICNMSFSSFSDRIKIKNPVGTLHIGDEEKIYLTFRADAWSPRVLNITGYVKVGSPYRIPTNTTASLIINLQTTFSIKVYVGHSGYDVIQEDGFTIQKKDSINLVYGEEANLMFFLTGNGTASMGINSENCTIEEIRFQGGTVESPFRVGLLPDREVNGSVRIKADVPDTSGRLIYVINYNGKTYEYHTDIRVGPEPEKSTTEPVTEENRSAVTAFLILAGVGATAYVLAPKARTREKKKKETEHAKKGKKR